jgi:ketosteroid isomerase-like protein
MQRSNNMSRLIIIVIAIASLLIVGVALCVAGTISPLRAQPTTDVERVKAANQVFASAVETRDIREIDKVWAHVPYATFIGPLSTDVVVGWNGVRKAWEMRFGQFNKVTITATESHIQTNGKVAWTVGMERVQLLPKDSKIVAFDAFVTNVFENQDGRWLLVSHQTTPVFSEAK